MSDIQINELEAAINYWRNQSPAAGDELCLCTEAAALAKPYALMIVQRRSSLPITALDERARAAWEACRAERRLDKRFFTWMKRVLPYRRPGQQRHQ